MMKRFFALLLVFCLLFQMQMAAQAQALALVKPFTGNVNKLVAGTLTKYAARAGFAANDPRIAATLDLAGKALDAGLTGSGAVDAALLVAGATTWGTAALAVGAVGLVGWGAYKLYKEMVTDPSTGQQVEAIRVADTTQPLSAQTAAPTGFSVGQTALANSAGSVSSTPVDGHVSLVMYRSPTCDAALNSSCLQYSASPPSRYFWNMTVNAGVPFNTLNDALLTHAINECGLVAGCSAQAAGPVSVSADGKLSFTSRVTRPDGTYTSIAQNFAPRTDAGGAPAVVYGRNLGDALAQLPAASLNGSIPDDVIAGIAAEALNHAASMPGYNGIPVSTANPVTADDVGQYRLENPNVTATGNDLMTTPYSDASPNAIIITTAPNGSTDTGSDPTPAPSGIYNVNVVNNPGVTVLNKISVDLGADPGVALPTLENTPAASAILEPIFNLFPSLRSYAVPPHTATCPSGEFNLFGGVQSFSAHCDLLEQVRAVVGGVMLFAWAFLALRVTLSA
jgi:hypothetical protein